MLAFDYSWRFASSLATLNQHHWRQHTSALGIKYICGAKVISDPRINYPLRQITTRSLTSLLDTLAGPCIMEASITGVGVGAVSSYAPVESFEHASSGDIYTGGAGFFLYTMG